MKSGLEGRNNRGRSDHRPGKHHQVSMKSGLEGRNNHRTNLRTLRLHPESQ